MRTKCPPSPENPRTRPIRRRPIYQEPVDRSISAAEQLRRAQFQISVAQTAQLPPDRGAEVAFAGRSNAGKSSALNAIADHRGLARVSKTPGRTRLINYFTIDDRHALVDLPGYGYAAVDAGTRAGWDELLGGYLRERQALRGVILIMDCRHPLGAPDAALLDFCAALARPAHVLLSKADKLAHGARVRTLDQVRQVLDRHSGLFSVQLFSATSGLGVDEARERICVWLGLEFSPAKKSPGNKGKKFRGA